VRRIYQTTWHGIPFNTFATLSSTVLADPQFYHAFYKAFFERYRASDELNPDWVHLKVESIRRVHGKIFSSKEARILSVGCGLGIQEKALLDLGYSDLEVTEVSELPLRWIRPYLSKERIHVGLFPSCLPDDRKYDSILLAGIDVFFDKRQWVGFLSQVKAHLTPAGNCAMISWTLEHENPYVRAMQKLKDKVLGILESLRLRHRGQFWGYARTRQEYRMAFARAGFTHLRDETIDTGTSWLTYCLMGYGMPVEGRKTND